MFGGILQKIALNWVKNNAVELVAQGILILVDQYEKVQPYILTRSKAFTREVIHRVYDLNPSVGLYISQNEQNKTDENIEKVIKSVGYHLEAFATKGDQSSGL